MFIIMKPHEDIVVSVKFNKDGPKKILQRNIDQIITEEDFWRKLRSGKKLRLKHGVDPTNPFLHLGHAVNYWKMREFQELGHKVIFLIGDFTAQIGDPTGKSKARLELSKKEVEENAQKYLEQATKILINKPTSLEIRRNSEWYGKMQLAEFLALAKKITHSRLIERDMFQKRIKNKEEIYIHELLYPILQGYDSVMTKSDITIIGSDQLFNELIGRHYQEIFAQEPQVIMTTTITPGLDGKEKMSKSLGNYVAIIDSPKDKFGKIMTLSDNLIHSYLTVYTNLSPEEIMEVDKLHPLEAKKRLAFEIVKSYHGEKEALKTQENFKKTFSQKETPNDLKTLRTIKDETWGDFLIRERFVKSKSEAKRLVDGGGVDVDGKKVEKASNSVSAGVAKIGKHTFIKIKKP